MGFYEDDRIRSKNKKWNEAFEMLATLKALGYADSDVVAHATSAMNSESDPYRNEVYSTMISIVRGSDESKSSTSS